MSKAFVKRMVLPDAPKPTKSMRVDDPRDKERAMRLMEHHEIDLQRLTPNGKKKTGPQKAWFWDDARVTKLRRMYNEGYPVKEIARECGARNVNACQEKINKEIAAGNLERRNKRLSAEDIRKIVDMRETGMRVQDIAKDLRTTKDSVKGVLYRYYKKQGEGK